MTVFENLEIDAVQALQDGQSFKQRVEWVYTPVPIRPSPLFPNANSICQTIDSVHQ